MELKTFENVEFGSIRTVTKDNEPWFVASDICKALELSNPTVATQRLDEDERSKFNLGRQGEAVIVNEFGLYNLVLVSRKQGAKEFKRWITHEVLPSIRKSGGYIATTTEDTPETIMAKALVIAQETINKTKQIVKEQAEKIASIAPKALFADAVSASASSILVRDLAKLIRQNGMEIGEKRLYKWLREHGYVCKGSTTQKAMELGLFEIVVRTVERGKRTTN